MKFETKITKGFLLARIYAAQRSDASGDKALREINARAQFARRSIAQRVRWMVR